MKLSAELQKKVADEVQKHLEEVLSGFDIQEIKYSIFVTVKLELFGDLS